LNIFKKIKTIFYFPVDLSIPDPELRSDDLAFIVNETRLPSDNFIEGLIRAMAIEAEELNSGVMIKDGTVWHNLN